MTDSLTKLTEVLSQLPGIGPRQSRRLAFWIVRRDPSWVKSFSSALLGAREQAHVCVLCKRIHPKNADKEVCHICASDARDKKILMLVERDVDLENIERTGSYKGRYFVLGGTTSPLDKTPEKSIRIDDLLDRVSNTTESVEEIILAVSATTEGEDTSLYLENRLRVLVKKNSITLTHLGRGLSTGTELEYVDKETMRHALNGRV